MPRALLYYNCYRLYFMTKAMKIPKPKELKSALLSSNVTDDEKSFAPIKAPVFIPVS